MDDDADRDLVDAFREMHRRWRSGLPVEGYEVDDNEDEGEDEVEDDDEDGVRLSGRFGSLPSVADEARIDLAQEFDRRLESLGATLQAEGLIPQVVKSIGIPRMVGQRCAEVWVVVNEANWAALGGRGQWEIVERTAGLMQDSLRNEAAGLLNMFVEIRFHNYAREVACIRVDPVRKSWRVMGVRLADT